MNKPVMPPANQTVPIFAEGRGFIGTVEAHTAEQMQAHHAEWEAHCAALEARLREVEGLAQSLIDADMEYEAARRDWDRAIADDPIAMTSDEWMRVSTRFENAVMDRIAKRNELAATLEQSNG